MIKVTAIVPAAGKGRRIKSKIDKPYLEICDKPIIAHTLLRLSGNRHINEIIVAVNRGKIKTFKRRIIDRFNIKKVKIVSGGKERKDSVFNALKEVHHNTDYVLIHDGVRPFITDKIINSSLKTAQRFKASVVAVPVKATLKYSKKDSRIYETIDRKRFWEAQTPQVFRKELIEKAYARLGSKKINITDDSMLVEAIGVKPKIVLGSYSNIKITTQDDLALANILVNKFKTRN